MHTKLHLMEMPQESNKPKIAVISLEEFLAKNVNDVDTVRSNDPQHITKVTKTFGSLTLGDLRETTINMKPTNSTEKFAKEESDLNPLICFAFSLVAGTMSYGGWIATNYMVGHFAVKFLQSDFYPAQRAAIAARNIIVGVFMLFSGFSAAIAVGILLLGLSVARKRLSLQIPGS